MITVWCDLVECKWNDGRECIRDEIEITDTFHADAPAKCADFDDTMEGDK